MRIFLVKLGVYLMIIAGVDFIIGSCMDYILANTVKGDYGRNNYISLQSHQSCLIFGSSRAIHHYNPDTIAHALNMSCYNCGEDGMGIITMLGRYLMIRQRYVPKLIIYDVSGFDIEKDDRSKYIGWLRYFTKNERIAELIEQVDETEKFKSIAQSYKYNSRFVDIIIQFMSKNPQTAENYKYAPLTGVINYDVKETHFNNVTVDSLKLSLFKKMIQQCKNDGTKFIVVLSPEYKAINDSNYRPIINLCNQYRIPVLNHYKDKDINFNSKLFKDASHLNIEGVKIFNKKICIELHQAFK
mgnify:CR=1 FL=1